MEIQLHQNNSNHINDCAYTEDETEVGNILLDLPYLITKSLSTCRFPYNWSTKKRRNTSPPSQQQINPPIVKTEAASSPNTPLSFSLSPTHSDSKFKRSAHKNTSSLNLKKKELEEMLREKTVTNEQLKESVGKVKEYYKALSVKNSELKAIRFQKRQKRKIDMGLKVMTPCTTQMQQLQTTSAVNDRVHAVPSTSTEFHPQSPFISLPIHQRHGVNNQVHAGPSTSTQFQQHHQPPQWINYQPTVVNDPLCAAPSTSTQFPYPSSLINNNQQYFIIHHHQQQQELQFTFDLNLEPEDIAKAQATAARRNRFHANKEKKTRAKH